jgi:DNA-binding CsgD family transcriptional regulator
MFETLLQELAGGMTGIEERDEGIAFLKVAKSVYPISLTAYLAFNIPVNAQPRRYLQCTYSDQWVKHCVSREMLAPNRLAALGPALRGPLDWNELPEMDETSPLIDLTRGALAGRHLLSFPLRALAGEAAVFCVAAEMPAADWQLQKARILPDFQALANYFHQHVLRIYGHDASSAILVSARELDCLKWVAAGKTAWEASIILGISERTVRFHLNAAREKLDCLTTTQAVAKAVSQQLI